MQRYTKESIERGASLWDELDADVGDADFVKSSSVAVDDVPLSTGPRLPGDLLMKVGHERVTMPSYPGKDAPVWAKTAYDEEVRDAMMKIAGFFGEAFHNLGRTLKNVLRGTSGQSSSTARDMLRNMKYRKLPKGTIEVSIEELSKGLKGSPSRSVKDVLRGMKYTKPSKGMVEVSIDELAKGVKSIQRADPLEGKYRGAQVGIAIGAPLLAYQMGGRGWNKGRVRRAHGRVERALMVDPDFENVADKEQGVSESYGLMRKYAPNIALDPIVSKSFVKLLVSHPDHQNVDVIQNLMEAEKKFNDSREFSSDFRDIQRLFNPIASLAGKEK